jgi:hypothetical protein
MQTVVNATSLEGAGVGAGPCVFFHAQSFVSRLAILDGQIAAKSGNGAGIGPGISAEGFSSVIDLEISGGNVTASSSGYGAGIGSGSAEAHADATTVSIVTNLRISGGNITAVGFRGVGIGAGNGMVNPQSVSAVNTLVISNSVVRADCVEFGAGIGALRDLSIFNSW